MVHTSNPVTEEAEARSWGAEDQPEPNFPASRLTQRDSVSKRKKLKHTQKKAKQTLEEKNHLILQNRKKGRKEGREGGRNWRLEMGGMVRIRNEGIELKI